MSIPDEVGARLPLPRQGRLDPPPATRSRPMEGAVLMKRNLRPAAADRRAVLALNPVTDELTAVGCQAWAVTRRPAHQQVSAAR
jgi:hypothetical protein